MPTAMGVRTISRAWECAAALILAVLVVLSVHFSTTGDEYGISNPGWNGTSAFFDAVLEEGGTVIADTSLFNDYEDSLLLLVAPADESGEGDFGIYRTYLHQNNTIFIADETGASNVMLQGIGSSMRVVPVNVSSLDTTYTGSFFPNGHPAAGHPLLVGVETLAFNRPTHVTGGESLLISGLFSWQDLNGDGRMDAGEPTGTFSFLAREEIGAGEVIVCSDPSLLINAMQGREAPEGNRAFVENLRSYRSVMLVDGVTSAAARDRAVLAGLRSSSSLQAGLLAASLFVVAVLWRKKYRVGWVDGT
ncbi:DUF4350 domain-containing protein [Methanofollis formosanus]|uniref:DUF4350 domain-containing protein n=1 Tax=Methanofollis formosanus TaxID=299308 RepID=A0A8G1EE83_9EURY|nr:DUF4350 domain-containing protein [Methanofollis formosanus]QYZ77925.1 DUF4350 domain-containing protein [Methanofollis formosanus]